MRIMRHIKKDEPHYSRLQKFKTTFENVRFTGKFE